MTHFSWCKLDLGCVYFEQVFARSHFDLADWQFEFARHRDLLLLTEKLAGKDPQVTFVDIFLPMEPVHFHRPRQ